LKLLQNNDENPNMVPEENETRLCFGAGPRALESNCSAIKGRHDAKFGRFCYIPPGGKTGTDPASLKVCADQSAT